MLGCNEDAARWRRKRLPRSCKMCVRKFGKQKLSVRGPMRHRRKQKKEQPLKKKAPEDDSRRKSRKRSSNRLNIHAPIAKHHCTAMFATEKFMLSGTAASSFACETVLLYVLSPMLAPHVARRSSRRKLPGEYKANTRRLMAKPVQGRDGSLCKTANFKTKGWHSSQTRCQNGIFETSKNKEIKCMDGQRIFGTAWLEIGLTGFVERCGAWLRNKGSQQDSSPRRCQKHAQRCFRNSIFGTTKGRQGNTRHFRTAKYK